MSRDKHHWSRGEKIAGWTLGIAVVGIVLAVLVGYIPVLEPDLRYSLSQSPNAYSTIDVKVQDNGDWLVYSKVTINITNRSWRSGYVARVTVVPLAISTNPTWQVTQITSDPIGRNESQAISISFLLTIPTDALNHVGTTRDLPVELTFDLFDNTGKRVDRYTNGLWARMKFNGNVHLTESPLVTPPQPIGKTGPK